MTKNKLFLFILLFFFFCALVNAALPLIFVQFAAAAIESFVVRSVARQVVVTVGTAANDATWVQTFLTWMNIGRAIGSVAVAVQQDGKPVTVEVQVSSNSKNDLSTGTVLNKIIVSWSLLPSETVDNLLHTSSIYRQYDLSCSVASKCLDYAIPLYNLYAKNKIVGYKDCVYYFPYCAVQYQSDSGSLLQKKGDIEEIDGIKRIIGTPGNWKADPTDPDWSLEELNKYTGQSAIRFDGLSTSNPAHLDLYASAANSLGMQFQEQFSPGQVRTLIVDANANSTPVDVQTIVAPGGLTTTPVPPSSGGSTIVFPSDYARQGEAASAATSVVNTINNQTSKIDQLSSDLKATSDTADPTLPDASAFSDSFFNGTFKNLLSWSVPAHSSVCPTAGFAWNGATYQIDSHCLIIENNFSIFQSVMLVVWTFSGLFVVLRA